MISLPWLRNKCETKVGEPMVGYQENLLPPDQQGEAEKPERAVHLRFIFLFQLKVHEVYP